jgi:hypothetical protein
MLVFGTIKTGNESKIVCCRPHLMGKNKTDGSPIFAIGQAAEYSRLKSVRSKIF